MSRELPFFSLGSSSHFVWQDGDSLLLLLLLWPSEQWNDIPKTAEFYPIPGKPCLLLEIEQSKSQRSSSTPRSVWKIWKMRWGSVAPREASQTASLAWDKPSIWDSTSGLHFEASHPFLSAGPVSTAACICLVFASAKSLQSTGGLPQCPRGVTPKGTRKKHFFCIF